MRAATMLTRLQALRLVPFGPRASVRDFRAGAPEALDADEHVSRLVRQAGLKPHHSVLELGSPPAPALSAFASFLAEDGRYEGIDLSPPAPAWGARTGTASRGNVRVHRRPRALRAASGGRYAALPFPARTFDLVVMGSVLARTLPVEANHLVSEACRVARPRARLVMDVFLLNDESVRGIENGASSKEFLHEYTPDCRVVARGSSEADVGYYEGRLESMLASHRFQLVQAPTYGSWSGRERYAGYWDVVIAEKV